MNVSSLPTGIVTFLYSDIEGSTPLWEQMPEAMRWSLALHDEILRQAISAHAGHTYKVIGDAFQAAFAEPTQALAAAVDAQRRLAAAGWGETGPLRVRMGLHTGESEERKNEGEDLRIHAHSIGDSSTGSGARPLP